MRLRLDLSYDEAKGLKNVLLRELAEQYNPKYEALLDELVDALLAEPNDGVIELAIDHTTITGLLLKLRLTNATEHALEQQLRRVRHES